MDVIRANLVSVIGPTLSCSQIGSESCLTMDNIPETAQDTDLPSAKLNMRLRRVSTLIS